MKESPLRGDIMRVILLSDLHIKPNSNADSLPWVNHFCDFIKNKYYSEALIFVLGDVIDKGNLNKESAFEAADQIFSFIESELSSVHYQIAFIPGNHDYCSKNTNEFMKFCCKHQNCGSVFDFSQNEAWEYSFDNINFIFIDSIQNGDYSMPGNLNLSNIRNCIKADKTNIILMHHSLIFEDFETHTGIVDQNEVIEFIDRYNIKFVFHGHAHATRFIPINNIMLYGIGSMGLDEKDLTGLQNEKEQFFEIITNRCGIESIVNWLWRSGSQKYEKILKYPEHESSYENGEHIPCELYPKPENYITRHVMPRDFAAADALTRYLKSEEKTTLYEACSKNKHILFIADAGLGKTFEMEYLAHVISVKNRYIRPILIHLKNYKNEPIEDYIYFYKPQYRTLDPEQFLLIMDGYDELAYPDEFKQALSKYMDKNPNTQICISMRSNFLSSNFTAFQDFSVYQLLELENTDIQRELNKNGVDEVAFYNECDKKNMLSLLQNPFYLRKLISIFISDGFLPNQTELMDRIIEEQFSEDATKFEYTLKQSFEECIYEVELALIRFAYGLQLLNASACDAKTYQTILNKEDRQYIKCSSLTINTSFGHSFSHNIFREYLIAKHISQTSYDNILEHISILDKKYLNPYWFNILGFILQLNPYEEIKEWIIETEPLALTKIEPERVRGELRYSILESTLLNIVSKNIWFRNELCSYAQLATFMQSPHAIDLLLNHIKAPTHFRSLYFCLNVISNFSELYGKDKIVRQVLVECYQNGKVRAYEKRVAISAIATLNLETQIITEDLVTRFAESVSSDERLGVYEYLLKVDKTNENIDFLLAGIKNISYSYKDNEVSNGTEHFRLMDCLSNIDESYAIERIISWYSSLENMNLDFYKKRNYFLTFLARRLNCIIVAILLCSKLYTYFILMLI